MDEALLFLQKTQHAAVNILGMDKQKVFGLHSKMDHVDIVVWDGPFLRCFPVEKGEFKKWYPECSIQLHGPENMFVEMHNKSGNSLIQIRNATFVELKEGQTTFKAAEIFWIGEFTQPQDQE